MHTATQIDILVADWKAAGEGLGICINSGRPCPGCATCRKAYLRALALSAAEEAQLPQRDALAVDIAARFQRCHAQAATPAQATPAQPTAAAAASEAAAAVAAPSNANGAPSFAPNVPVQQSATQQMAALQVQTFLSAKSQHKVL